MALAPGFLERSGHADEQHVGAACPDFLDDARVIIRAEVAVAEACDLEAGVLRPATLRQRSDDLALGAEKIDAQLVLPGCRQQARHEVNTGHALRYRLARSPQ